MVAPIHLSTVLTDSRGWAGNRPWNVTLQTRYPCGSAALDRSHRPPANRNHQLPARSSTAQCTIDVREASCLHKLEDCRGASLSDASNGELLHEIASRPLPHVPASPPGRSREREFGAGNHSDEDSATLERKHRADAIAELVEATLERIMTAKFDVCVTLPSFVGSARGPIALRIFSDMG